MIVNGIFELFNAPEVEKVVVYFADAVKITILEFFGITLEEKVTSVQSGETFTVKVVTNANTEGVKFFNENKKKLSQLDCTVPENEDDTKT